MYAPHASEVGVLERLGLLEILGLRIHHPNVGIRDIGDLAAGAFKYSREDGRLVLQQKCTKGDREDKAEIFGPVTGQHFERNKVHASSPFLSLGIPRYSRQTGRYSIDS